MTTAKAKRRSRIKWISIAILAVVVVLAVIYLYVATDKFSDTKARKADYTLNALGFIQEFQQNLKAANEKYTDKIIALNGKVSDVEAADTTLNVKFVDPVTSSYAIFAFQHQHLDEAKKIKAGDSISIKGSCSGGVYSEILDASSITFKRSTLINKYTN